MTRRSAHVWQWVISGLAALCLGFMGCSVDSAESAVRQVDIIVEGFYAHPDDNSQMVAKTTGAPVTSLSLRQSGDELEGFDNNGILFKGTLGQVIEGTRATFNLEGRTTGGQSATISGSFDVDGTVSTMRGTWIEPTLASVVFGQATVPTNPVPPAATNVTTEVTLNQTLVSLGTSETTTFTAAGGAPPYTWRVGNANIGSITSITGSGNVSATYTASGSGNNTVIVTDSEGGSATATVRQSSSPMSVDPVTLNQTLVTLDADGGATTFTASGGTGNFSWRVSNSSLGRISTISGARNASSTYIAIGEGTNRVTVTDGARDSVRATVIQESGN